MRMSSVAIVVLCFPSLVGTATANVHVRFPEDILPDFYTSAPVDALHDDEWAVIPFWRPPDCVRADYNMMRGFDAAAVNCPLLVEGFAEFNDVGPQSTEARGLGAVPVVFVLWSELQAATADRVLTIGELKSLPSYVVGTADVYNDQNHIYVIHRVSHYALVAHGTLTDGRSFDVAIVEVDLVLVRVLIEFGE